MDHKLNTAIMGLKSLDWEVDVRFSPGRTLPVEIAERYGNIPAQFKEFLSCVQTCNNAGFTAWLLCVGDYAGTTGKAFLWNEWETISLQAFEADNDVVGAIKVKQYWNAHMPIGQSVGSGYAYLAVRLDDGLVVFGEEPEFEESTVVAGSFYELLEMLTGEREMPVILQRFM